MQQKSIEHFASFDTHIANTKNRSIFKKMISCKKNQKIEYSTLQIRNVFFKFNYLLTIPSEFFC